MSITNGWELSNRTHFNDIVSEYESIRPEWPSAIFDDIDGYLKPDCTQMAVEIGAGTGKATAPFLKRGYDVTAVEINEQMSAYLIKRFDRCKNFKVITSSFEEVTLDEGVFDLIYAASAFHWVNAEVGCPKAFRLLKTGGVIALFRYNEIASVGNELYDAIRGLYVKYYDSYYKIPYCMPVRKTHDDFRKVSEIHKGFRFNDLREYGFRNVTMKFYDVSLTYSADKYISFLRTLADHRNLPESLRTAFHEEIKDTILNHGGYVTVEYVFQLYMGRK